MRKIFVLLLCSIVSYAQPLNTALFKKMKTRYVGPAVMSGRITAIDAVVSNPEIIYVGAASGGVWKSENGGGTWTPIFDDMPTLNIGSLAVQQSNPSVIWTGTGEGNPRNSINIGAGIYKSLDAGKTWMLMGLEKTKNIHKIIIDPQNPNTVYAGVIGNPYAEHAERGVYKTTDGGQTWERVLHTNEKSGVADMIIDPSNPNKLFVAMWEHRRTAWDFKSGGKGSGFYVTLDGGKSWKKLDKTNGLPDGDFGRLGLAICHDRPNRVYALVEATKNGLYRSDDGGNKWEKINEDPKDVTNRAFYFNEIYCDPQNENRLYSLAQMISMSEDGGKSFKTVANFQQAHADHHALWIHPQNPNFIINGNDGGVTISRDRAKTWIYVTSLPLGQFYHINVDNEVPYNVYGGLQDNGSWKGPAYTWTDGGLRNYYWQEVNGGDGFDVMPDPEDARYGYAASQGGFFMRYDSQTGKNVIIRPTHPDIKTRLRFNWNAAMAQDPHDKATIYYGSQFLHKSTDKGNTWEIISSDLTLNNPEQQKQDQSGGLSLDITSAENHNTILTIAPSPKEKGVIWVGTDDGNIQLSRDGGKSWTNLNSKIKGLPKEAWIPQIRASKYNGGEAFVTANHYRTGDFAPYIFRTKDYGQTWERIVDENKVRGYALCFQQDTEVPNLFFCGTEHGLWISTDEARTWTQWKSGFPSVSTMDLAIQEREADLAIATFGRAIYILDNIRPLRKIAQNQTVLSQKLAVFEPSEAYLAQYKDPIGYGSGGDGMYEGENRKRGATISYFVNPPKKEDASQATVKYDSVFVRIYNKNNQLIRTLRDKPDSAGIHRFGWNLDERGMRMPSATKAKKDAPEPSGLAVLPDTYKIVMSYGDQKDSTNIVVKADPRFRFNANDEEAKRVLFGRLRTSIGQLTAATDHLADAQEIAEKLNTLAKDTEGKETEDWRKQIKAVQDSIKNVRSVIIPKELEKQGYGRPYRLTAQTKATEAMMYLRMNPAAPRPAEIQLVEQAETLTKEAVEKVNQFFATQWADFRKKAEARKLF